MRASARRFGEHGVTRGPFKGSLHIADRRYLKFLGELSMISTYLESRIVPTEPEEAYVRSIVLNLQNIIEYESEGLIRDYIAKYPTEANLKYLRKMEDDFVSTRSKYDWLRGKKRSLIDATTFGMMDEIRDLRNDLIHARPTQRRIRLKYAGMPLLTQASLRSILIDAEKVLQMLRKRLGKKSRWGTIPPGYATEMQWPKEAIELFDNTGRALNTEEG